MFQSCDHTCTATFSMVQRITGSTVVLQCYMRQAIPMVNSQRKPFDPQKLLSAEYTTYKQTLLMLQGTCSSHELGNQSLQRPCHQQVMPCAIISCVCIIIKQWCGEMPTVPYLSFLRPRTWGGGALNRATTHSHINHIIERDPRKLLWNDFMRKPFAWRLAANVGNPNYTAQQCLHVNNSDKQLFCMNRD